MFPKVSTPDEAAKLVARTRFENGAKRLLTIPQGRRLWGDDAGAIFKTQR